VGGACGTYGGKDGCMQYFGGGKSQGKRPLRRLALDRRVILKWVFELKYNKYVYNNHTQLYILLDYIRL